jgi:putative ABC transport system permease protein
MTMRGAPPAAAERLLNRLVGGGEWGECILGDLHEEYVERATRATAPARAWYWVQVAKIGSRTLARRVSRRRQPRWQPQYRAPVTPSPSRRDSLMRTLNLEIRHSFRALLKRPAMSAIVIVTLGLGLGSNAAVFAMVDALFLRPFTLHDIDRLTMTAYTVRADIDRRNALTPADFLDIKRQQNVFDRFAAFRWWDANLVGRDEPEAVQGFFVSADFFPALGIEPIAGRTFLEDEEIDGRHRKVVLGYGLWERRFGADRSIVGQAIEIDGVQHEVVGITPKGFDFPMGAQLWAPLSFDTNAATERRSQFLTGIGHLAEGKSLDDAKAQIAVIGERITREHPDTNKGREGRLYTLPQGMRDLGLGPILSMWQASAVFVLLIACANVANLLLARGAERQREMAVRLAIGASRARVIREQLIDSTLLSLASVPVAIAIAWASMKGLVAYMPPKIARFVSGWYSIDVDARFVAFTIALALLTGVIFGVIPALQASRPRLAESLKEGGRSSTAGGSRLRLRRALVVAEVALVLPLLVAAGLAVSGVYRFLNGPQGYDHTNVVTMQLVLPQARYPDDETRRRFVESAVMKLSEIAGVELAAVVNVPPSVANNSGNSIEIEGHPNPDPVNPPSVDSRRVTSKYFSALRIPIVRGRDLNDSDRENTLQVAVISESMARQYWPDSDPIGKRVKVGLGANAPWVTVVGISGDIIHEWFSRRNYPTIYRPYRQAPSRDMALLIRTAGNPSTFVPAAKAAMRAVDPAQPMFEVRPLRDSLKERTVGPQFMGGVMLVFGVIALVLAIVGVYGVMAHMVVQRTHEIGVRMALGATRRDVLGLTVRQTGTLTAIGVGIGLVLSVALGRLIEAGLMGTAAMDLRLVGAIAMTLVLSALAAGYLPARRAASIDPMTALRAE